LRKLDVILLAVGATLTLFWVLLSSKDGFKSSNATIVARSIAVVATMDGQIENDPPAVGSQVNNNDLLVRIHNSRFDRGRLIEFESQVAYLETEIDSLQRHQVILESQQREFNQRAASYAAWMLNDAQLKHKEFAAQESVAKARKRLEDEEVDRALQLFGRNLTSEVEMQIEKTQAEVAGAIVDVSSAQFERSALMLRTMQQDGMFFDNGDTSYWEKMGDTLSIRKFDGLNRIAMLQAQLVQARTQAKAEGSRIDTSFAEEHRAPFEAKVSARFVTEGTRVTSGTQLLQILNCTEPVVIIPIPNNRVTEFAVGLRVSVYPIDSDQELSGHIEYISSGPMLRTDTTIQIQQEITHEGNRAIVSLDNGQDFDEALQSCETARIAVVLIHTQSLLNSITSWL
jgi:multidrug resistance efflux pump